MITTKSKYSDHPPIADLEAVDVDSHLDQLLHPIDAVGGRNRALRNYVHALYALQLAHEMSNFGETREDVAKNHADIDRAQAAVAQAFDALIVCEFSLNRNIEVIERIGDSLTDADRKLS
jgi:hypothetical protein